MTKLFTQGRGTFWGVARSPDGQIIAVIENDCLKWFYAQTYEQLGEMFIDDIPAGSVIFSPDSRLAIVYTLGGPDNVITDLSFSPDGRRIVAAAGGSAWVWDIRPGQPPITTKLFEGVIGRNLIHYVHTVTAAALSPNGWTLAAGSSENTIGLYSLGNQNPTRQLTGHTAAIEKLAFSPDGRALLSVDADGSILFWNVFTGELVEAIYSHYGEIGGLVFQENGDLIGWQAGTTWTFDLATGEVLHTTQIYSGIILAVSPLGDWLAAIYPFQVSLWDVHTGEFWQTLGGEAPEPFVDYRLEGLITQGYFGAAFNSDGTPLVTLCSGGIDVYDLLEETLLLNIPGDCADQTGITLDTEWLITTPRSYYHWLGIYDIRTGGSVFDFPQYMNSYLQYQFSLQYKFSPDNRWVDFVNKMDDTYQFHLRDFASHTLLQTLNVSEEIPLLSLAFSPDTRLVALGQADGQIFLLDLSTFQIVATLSGHRGAVEYLAFSPDGKYLASGGQDGTIRVWGIPK